MIIFGTYPKVYKDDNIKYDQKCPQCHSTNSYLVMLHRIPHLFFIPIPFLTADQEPGIVCRDCQSKYELEDKFGYLVEKYYAGKISKEELIQELKK